MTTTNSDVLIVGAGPVGTTLAIDLVRRGVRVRIIERQTMGSTDRGQKEFNPEPWKFSMTSGCLTTFWPAVAATR
jgi:2-polyprenyl-6-methoxyphenol hydroxylase-like FAD-dependent oxidoreductase